MIVHEMGKKTMWKLTGRVEYERENQFGEVVMLISFIPPD